MSFEEIKIQELKQSKYPNGLSIYSVVFNAEKTLELVLQSVKPFADEIIIINQGSTDRTGEIARKYATHYEERDKPLGFPEPDRLYAMNKCKFRWILPVDSDEIYTQPLLYFIRNTFANQNNYDGLRCQIISIFEDKIPSIEYCCKYVCFRKDDTTIRPVLHAQIEGIKYPFDAPQFVMLHLQGSSAKQLKKLDTYDRIVDELLDKKLVSEDEAINKKGINEKSRGFMK